MKMRKFSRMVTYLEMSCSHIFCPSLLAPPLISRSRHTISLRSLLTKLSITGQRVRTGRSEIRIQRAKPKAGYSRMKQLERGCAEAAPYHVALLLGVEVQAEAAITVGAGA